MLASSVRAQLRPLSDFDGPTVRTSQAQGTLIACGPSTKEFNQPLYVVDGVRVEHGAISSLPSRLDPADVLHIDVLRGAEATSRYGVAARNGAVEITTRNAPPHPAPGEAALTPFPNPVAAGAAVTLRVDLPEPGRIDVFDVLGRRAWTQAVAAGSETIEVPTSGLAAGAYVVRVSGAGGAVSHRVTVR